MAKKFQFDDEMEEVVTFNKEENHEVVKEVNNEFVESEDSLMYEEEEVMTKKKKFVWKWWHYALISLFVLMVAFVIYIFIKSNNDGPVYGNRLDGLLEIQESALEQSEKTVLDEHDSVESIDMTIEGKKVKINITFKDNTSTKTVKSISKDALKILDENVGYDKADNDEYSCLLGIYKNVTQYEVNYYLIVDGNKDFPAFASKHVQNDEITYTFASIADQESHDKAKSTLED